MTINDQLLAQIHDRKGSSDQFGYGITTAASYVKQFAEHCGDIDGLAAISAGGMPSLAKAVKDAEQTLVYANPGMVIESKANRSSFGDLIPKDSDVEIPKNTLMVFQHVVTTPSVDRDNDVLKTEGAIVDPKTTLLWQHIPTLPLGKRLLTVEHTKDVLRMVTALVDINDLTADIAKMLEADILRISHGFRALEFTERKVKDGQAPGFEVTKFEIMEISLVSVPSNVDAEVEAFAGAKLTSDVMKGYAEHLIENNLTRHVRGHVAEEVRFITLNELGKTVPRSESKYYDGSSVAGSFEHTRDMLQRASKSHLESNAVAVAEHDWVYLVATFSDKGIICHNHESGDETCYEAFWRTEDGTPTWTGDLKEVEITATIREKMIAAKNADIKAGKVLSKANEAKLRDAVDDLAEVAGMDDIPRAAKSLVNGAKTKVKAVIAATGNGDDDGKTVEEIAGRRSITDADVLNHFLTKSAKSAYDLHAIVRAALLVHEQEERANQFESGFPEN